MSHKYWFVRLRTIKIHIGLFGYCNEWIVNRRAGEGEKKEERLPKKREGIQSIFNLVSTVIQYVCYHMLWALSDVSLMSHILIYNFGPFCIFLMFLFLFLFLSLKMSIVNIISVNAPWCACLTASLNTRNKVLSLELSIKN